MLQSTAKAKRVNRVTAVLVDVANYGRLAPLLAELHARPTFELDVICCGSMPLRRFGRSSNRVLEDGLFLSADIFHEVEGSTPETMAQSCGLGVIHLAAELRRRAPDFVILIGDRYQALAAAVAARMVNCCLVHLQGGEQSGTIDESIRHAITQLAHYHGPATPAAEANLLRMMQDPGTILGVGCPSSDLAHQVKAAGYKEHDAVVSVYHPQTTRYGAESREMLELLSALRDLGRRVVMFWPNIDAGSDRLHKRIRQFRDQHRADWLEMRRAETPRDYLKLLAGSPLCVGNSSSFVRDAGFFGTPVVLVGDRQQGREISDNVRRCRCVAFAILYEAHIQLGRGRYEPSTLYGDGRVSTRFANALERAIPYREKRLYREPTAVGACDLETAERLAKGGRMKGRR